MRGKATDVGGASTPSPIRGTLTRSIGHHQQAMPWRHHSCHHHHHQATHRHLRSHLRFSCTHQGAPEAAQGLALPPAAGGWTASTLLLRFARRSPRSWASQSRSRLPQHPRWSPWLLATLWRPLLCFRPPSPTAKRGGENLAVPRGVWKHSSPRGRALCVCRAELPEALNAVFASVPAASAPSRSSSPFPSPSLVSPSFCQTVPSPETS